MKTTHSVQWNPMQCMIAWCMYITLHHTFLVLIQHAMKPPYSVQWKHSTRMIAWCMYIKLHHRFLVLIKHAMKTRTACTRTACNETRPVHDACILHCITHSLYWYNMQWKHRTSCNKAPYSAWCMFYTTPHISEEICSCCLKHRSICLHSNPEHLMTKQVSSLCIYMLPTLYFAVHKRTYPHGQARGSYMWHEA